MNIQDASRLTNLTKDTIRYYEKIGLLRPERQMNGYRTYQEREIKDMNFISKMKMINLPLKYNQLLLELKNKKTSLACKEETLLFIDKVGNHVDRQLDLLQTTEKIIIQIKRIVTQSIGNSDEESIIELLEKFDGNNI